MKISNKGFATSTALYGLFALFVLILMFTFQVMRTNNNNSKDISNQIEREFSVCRNYKLTHDAYSSNTMYNTCLSCTRNPSATTKATCCEKGILTGSDCS